ncbi:MAG TPA: Nif3-like dinuclear metal center hexameric protein [Aggregatilinea sp.]|uniref:Nif3-like dinuclear metal center hexameric protein n=1 Tax=Aggregatilinea sp. TaxID=2806333 RepID=UPI002CC0B00D|nr:Nif3-like dinuclear metal center hexameric protein [Aggregatilinea sp.]HML20820.1 Nif3-like dinuclear metal center hexameric protein [Aggregatilinea sp.]
MIQADLVQRLDDFFDTAAYDERGLWTGLLSPSDVQIYEAFAETEFLEGPWNGLMLDSTQEIDRVYLCVFPDEQVLDVVLATELERAAPGSLIFAHYPADLEESGRGFVGVQEAQMEALREHNISYYCCHAPLDCHPEISTVAALAKALKLSDMEPFAPDGGQVRGLHGRLRDADFPALAERVAEVTELPALHYSQVRFNAMPVERVAVIPGSGERADYLSSVRDLGCDTYITGSWWPRGNTPDVASRQSDLRELVPSLPMNLLGTSLYASEMVVLRDQMPAWFRNAGIEARFVRQSDPWR